MTKQIKELKEGRVRFQGVVEVVRDKKNIQFIVLKDASGKIQVTVDKVQYPEVGEAFAHLLAGATVLVEGELINPNMLNLVDKKFLRTKLL